MFRCSPGSCFFGGECVNSTQRCECAQGYGHDLSLFHDGNCFVPIFAGGYLAVFVASSIVTLVCFCALRYQFAAIVTSQTPPSPATAARMSARRFGHSPSSSSRRRPPRIAPRLRLAGLYSAFTFSLWVVAASVWLQDGMFEAGLIAFMAVTVFYTLYMFWSFTLVVVQTFLSIPGGGRTPWLRSFVFRSTLCVCIAHVFGCFALLTFAIWMCRGDENTQAYNAAIAALLVEHAVWHTATAGLYAYVSARFGREVAALAAISRDARLVEFKKALAQSSACIVGTAFSMGAVACVPSLVWFSTGSFPVFFAFFAVAEVVLPIFFLLGLLSLLKKRGGTSTPVTSGSASPSPPPPHAAPTSSPSPTHKRFVHAPSKDRLSKESGIIPAVVVG